MKLTVTRCYWGQEFTRIQKRISHYLNTCPVTLHRIMYPCVRETFILQGRTYTNPNFQEDISLLFPAGVVLFIDLSEVYQHGCAWGEYHWLNSVSQFLWSYVQGYRFLYWPPFIGLFTGYSGRVPLRYSSTVPLSKDCMVLAFFGNINYW